MIKKIVKYFVFFVATILVLWAIAAGFSKALSSKRNAPAFVKELKPFALVGHRGAPREYPGNTIPSFRRLLQIDPRAMLELDVWQSSDKKVIVTHDEDLAETTDGKGKVISHTLKEIKRLEAGYSISFDGGITYPFRGRKIPMATLEEVFEAFPRSRMSIDIKYYEEGFVEIVMGLIKKYNMTDRVTVGSFSSEVTGLINRKYPRVATTLGADDVTKFFILHKLYLSGFFTTESDVFMIPEFSDSNKPEYLGEGADQGFRLITERLINDARALGFPVFAWTINRKDNMERLVKWQIDGIVTDFPDLLKEVIVEKKKMPGKSDNKRI